jgi:hypothetical protein
MPAIDSSLQEGEKAFPKMFRCPSLNDLTFPVLLLLLLLSSSSSSSSFVVVVVVVVVVVQLQ